MGGGTYTCKTCSAKLFAEEDKMGASVNSIAFKRPISDEKIQSRKNKDGQWHVRCSSCHAALGSAIGGKNPHYRIQSTQIDLKSELGIPDTELPERKKEEGQEKSKGEQTIEIAGASMNAATLFGTGAVVGGIIAATVAFLICRNLETPLTATNSNATNTPVVTTPAPSRPPPPPTPVPTPLPPPPAPATTSASSTGSAGTI